MSDWFRRYLLPGFVFEAAVIAGPDGVTVLEPAPAPRLEARSRFDGDDCETSRRRVGDRLMNHLAAPLTTQNDCSSLGECEGLSMSRSGASLR